MAALWVSSRRLPGITQRKVLAIASIPCGGFNRPIELPHLETFPGAACCLATELPTYKAAPLQAPARARPQSVICHLSSVISLCHFPLSCCCGRWNNSALLSMQFARNSRVSIALLGVCTQCHFCKMLKMSKLKLRLENCLNDDPKARIS